MSARPTSDHIPDYQIEMAEDNIDLTLEILHAAPEGQELLDTLVFPMLDRKHLSEREHLQILGLTVGLLFLRLAEATKP